MGGAKPLQRGQSRPWFILILMIGCSAPSKWKGKAAAVSGDRHSTYNAMIAVSQVSHTNAPFLILDLNCELAFFFSFSFSFSGQERDQTIRRVHLPVVIVL